MEPSQLFMCDGCGTVTRVERVLRLSTAAPRFCPYCGAQALKVVKSSFAAIDAACFVGMPPTIVEAFWHEWALLKDGGGHTTLLSYVRARISHAAHK